MILVVSLGIIYIVGWIFAIEWLIDDDADDLILDYALAGFIAAMWPLLAISMVVLLPLGLVVKAIKRLNS